MWTLFTLNNIKTIIIVLGIAAVIWFYKDWQFQRAENTRIKQNASSLRKQDSLRFAENTYTKLELKEYLDYQRKDLKKYLDDQDIKLRNLRKIISQDLTYVNTKPKDYDLSEVLKAVKSGIDIKTPIKDSTDCMIIEGWVIYKNDSLKLDINSRKFKNKTDIITHIQRQQWKFLGIKTKFLGKRITTVTVKDECGKSKTFIVERKK